MILNLEEYKKKFNFKYSIRILRKRCQDGNLPTKHVAHKIGKIWIIEVIEDFRIPQSVVDSFNVTIKKNN